MGKLSWTHFYLACLENKIDVCRYDAKPKFRVAVDRHGISKYDLRYLNQRGHFEQVPFGHHRAELEVELDSSFSCRPTHLFQKPLVVEVVGAGFDKPPTPTILRFVSLAFSKFTTTARIRIALVLMNFNK
jgi:DNA ligase 4